eukprot:CAMPEP_0170779546 /NCGR_PEP_ID=MMETSP0733-20121128/13045_1 /TAXON_ID=186038 /ORGANISM="Fragilariopsis kerguelensis, Strain L26-C5" /LENGTH=672 /DNA_ID=CAMNT_0011123169 /DNA_START=139 /DNA_END=2157 /DNA_ORIENTATION=-
MMGGNKKKNGADEDNAFSLYESNIPHNHDVLCGRGGQTNNHPGNGWFRKLVKSNRALYKTCPKHTKMLVAKAIVQAVQQQDPPGRFMKLTNGDGTTPDSVWKSISYSLAVNKTSQALREKEAVGMKKIHMNNVNSKSNRNFQLEHQQQYNNSNYMSAAEKLEIANTTKEYIKSKDEIQATESLASLTNIAIQSATEFGPSTLSSSLQMNVNNADSTTNNYCLEGGNQKRKARTTVGKPSWWGTGSSQSPTNNIVTPGIASFVNSDNGYRNRKRMKVQRGGGNVAQRTSIDPLPLPTQPLEARQSTLYRFLNSTGLFGREKVAANAAATATGHIHIDSTPLPDTNISQSMSRMKDVGTINNNERNDARQQGQDLFSLNSQQSTSGAFSFSRPNQQQQQSSLPSSQGLIGTMTVGQLREQHMQKQQQRQQQQVQTFVAPHLEAKQNDTSDGVATSGSNHDDEEDMQDMPTTGLLNGNDNAVDTAAQPTKGLTSQVSDWLTSFFPTNTNSKFDEMPRKKRPPPIYDDDDGVAIPPPPGVAATAATAGEPSLARNISSTIFGLVESPSLLVNSLKSGISSNFWDPFSSSTVSFNSPSRQFPNASSSQQQHNQQQQQFGGNVLNGNNSGGLIGYPVLGQASEKRGSLLDDVEDTPMEKELRNAKIEETPRRGSLPFT